MPRTASPVSAIKPEFKIEWWPVERLVPYDKNPRKISPKAVEKVADSIELFGWRQPIVVDRKDVIILGHVRRQAAILKKWALVPVHVADLSPEKARALRLADNRTSEETTWDLELLTSELSALSLGALDLTATGFDGSEIDRLLKSGAGDPRVDAAPAPPEVPVSREGDLWLLGAHRIICGDCTSADVVARALGKTAPHLMVTDPPYGIQLDSEWRDRRRPRPGPLFPPVRFRPARLIAEQAPAEPSYMKKRIAGHHETSISGDTRADWSDAFALVPSIQAAYVWHAHIYSREALTGLLRIGFDHFQQIIWNKSAAAMTRTHYWYQHEPCWYVWKKKAPWFGKAGENKTVWDAASPKMMMGGSDEEKFDHPTQKPFVLMQRPILNHTRRGEAVYDPFLGSGTTLVAAEMSERVCFGVEIDPKYVDVEVLRWQKLTGKQACLETGEVFDSVAASRKEKLPARTQTETPGAQARRR